MTQFRILID